MKKTIRPAAIRDLRQITAYKSNPLGLAASTLEIRKKLLDVFTRTWDYKAA